MIRRVFRSHEGWESVAVIAACAGLIYMCMILDIQGQDKKPSVTPPAAGIAPASPAGFKSVDSLGGVAGVARQSADASKEPVCRLTFCTDNLAKVLIHRNDGKLVANARSLTIKMDRVGEPPYATCQIYDGLFPPTKPDVLSWRIAEIRFVTPADFQKLIDEGAADKADTPIDKVDPSAPSGVPSNIQPLIPIAPQVPLSPGTNTTPGTSSASGTNGAGGTKEAGAGEAKSG